MYQAAVSYRTVWTRCLSSPERALRRQRVSLIDWPGRSTPGARSDKSVGGAAGCEHATFAVTVLCVAGAAATPAQQFGLHWVLGSSDGGSEIRTCRRAHVTASSPPPTIPLGWNASASPALQPRSAWLRHRRVRRSGGLLRQRAVVFQRNLRHAHGFGTTFHNFGWLPDVTHPSCLSSHARMRRW